MKSMGLPVRCAAPQYRYRQILRRAARIGRKELLHFLSIARGSLSELDTLTEISMTLGYLNDGDTLQSEINQVAGLLARLRTSLSKPD